MQAIALKDFRIPARHIAKLSWGEVNESYRTNRRGAYYYSCSGHGGYVVDSRCLTPKERAKIDKYTQPYPLRILVQHRDGSGGDVVIGVDCREFISCGTKASFRGKAYRYYPSLGAIEWQELPVYIFEEDCDWAVLEKFTDIRSEGWGKDEVERRKAINRTFKNWIKERVVNNG
jgi:hypothetical protein